MVYPLLNPCPDDCRGKNRPGVGRGSRAPVLRVILSHIIEART